MSNGLSLVVSMDVVSAQVRLGWELETSESFLVMYDDGM